MSFVTNVSYVFSTSNHKSNVSSNNLFKGSEDTIIEHACNLKFMNKNYILEILFILFNLVGKIENYWEYLFHGLVWLSTQKLQ